MNDSPCRTIWLPRLLVIAAMVWGFSVRIWPIGRLGLNQFDEGIYWSAGTWIFHPGGITSLDPVLVPYAPPLYPILIGLTAELVGLSDQTGLLVSAIMGMLTIPIVARIGREIFGVRAGVVAAWCAACSGPHIAYSRMGLTDATFLCVWSVGFLGCLWFVRRPSWKSSVLMGLLVGLAQQSKYNGWLLGLFVVITFALGLIVRRDERLPERWVRLGGWGLLGAVVAALVVWPWFQFVENHGSYAKLLQHQRSYLGGWNRWGPNLLAQVNQSVALAGPLSLTVVNLAFVATSIYMISPGDRANSRVSRLGSGLKAFLIVPLIAAPVSTGVGLAILARSWIRVDFRFLVVAWIILFFLTPFYHPYARLWLPFELIQWLILGGLVEFLADWSSATLWPGAVASRTRWVGLILGGATWLGMMIFGPGFPLCVCGGWNHQGLFGPSDSIRIAVPDILNKIEPEVRGLKTFVRPAMANYLQGKIKVFPQADLGQFHQVSVGENWGLIDSTLITSNLTTSDQPDLDSLIEPILGRWELVWRFPVLTTLPTALDLDPARPEYQPDHAMAVLWLIRPRPENDPQ